MKVLGALEIALGIMGLFGAAVLLVVFGVGASVVGASGDPDAAVALPIIGITGMALVTFLVAAVAARHDHRHRPDPAAAVGAHRRRSCCRFCRWR